ncbi:MAG: C40 family peptidase [Cytophagales bacterium]|nr:C40 family peptidase [Cytophaga sp.]
MKRIILLFVVCFCLSSLLSCKGRKSKTQGQTPKVKTNKETVQQSNQKADKVISAARSYIGTPYKFGGTSRAGMDCSGLMGLCFKEAGITLPRTSAEQGNVGKLISYSELRPGDLVFFTDKKGNKKITHVGLISIVKGSRDVKFIHSSTKLGVVESDLYVSYYESILIKATRVFY